MADPRREKLLEYLRWHHVGGKTSDAADKIESLYAPAPAESEAELRDKLIQLLKDHKTGVLAEVVVNQILALLRPQPKPSPEDLERFHAIKENALASKHNATPANPKAEEHCFLAANDILWLLTKLLAAWGKGGEAK